MAERTGIEWTDSTFNPWIGCTKISPACDHCYAEAQMDTRMGRVKWGAGQSRSRTSVPYWKQPLHWNTRADVFRECAACGWRGDLALRADPMAFACPSCDRTDWREARRRVFCASLADVFDNEVDPRWLADLFDLIEATPNLDWLLRTKRIGNVRARIEAARESTTIVEGGLRVVRSCSWADRLPPNIWLGATICNQSEADRDIPKLLATRAAKRFLSIEPMLGEIDLRNIDDGHAHRNVPREAWGDADDDDSPPALWWDALTGKRTIMHGGADGEWSRTDGKLDWIICGGESGPHARPMHPDWARSLRDQCKAAGVPFLFKQWGEWAPCRYEDRGWKFSDTPHVTWWADQQRFVPFEPNIGQIGLKRVGKHAAGRLLDGRVHSEWPQ